MAAAFPADVHPSGAVIFVTGIVSWTVSALDVVVDRASGRAWAVSNLVTDLAHGSLTGWRVNHDAANVVVEGGGAVALVANRVAVFP